MTQTAFDDFDLISSYQITAGKTKNETSPSNKSVVSRPYTAGKLIIYDKPYFLVLKMALKMRINAMPPTHIKSKISGVIWLSACIIVNRYPLIVLKGVQQKYNIVSDVARAQASNN